MTQEKRKMIMDAFIRSQFGYCPLVWMFHSRGLNARINRIHERALRVVYQDRHSCFQELLEKSGSVTIHQRSLQQLGIELFKIKNDLAATIIKDIFQISHNPSYNLRRNPEFQLRSIKTASYGTESLS